ncbi:MAG: hypothetical protein [Bacteroides phage LoVEphage]|nr:MAG: hypothetical protein [Bacteroides phage LoVEphage]
MCNEIGYLITFNHFRDCLCLKYSVYLWQRQRSCFYCVKDCIKYF